MRFNQQTKAKKSASGGPMARILAFHQMREVEVRFTAVALSSRYKIILFRGDPQSWEIVFFCFFLIASSFAEKLAVLSHQNMYNTPSSGKVVVQILTYCKRHIASFDCWTFIIRSSSLLSRVRTIVYLTWPRLRHLYYASFVRLHVAALFLPHPVSQVMHGFFKELLYI